MEIRCSDASAAEASTFFTHALGDTLLVGAINVVVVGVIATLIAEVLGAPGTANVVVGVIAAFAAAIGQGALVFRSITGGRRGHRPRFPS